jgi:hypothetical protein
MSLVPSTRLGALLFTAVAVAAAATVTLPAQAAAPTYQPGDVVTVNGISVTAPANAGSVALTVDRVDGTSQTLSVTTDAAGRVTVGNDSATSGTTDVAPPKCDDPAYSLISGASWPGAYSWAFRRATTPNEMTKKAATRELKKAVNNNSNSSNACGLADQVDLPNNYQGSTTQASDVTSQPACVGNPQPINVTEFGPMGGGGILAATCTYSSGGTITNADVKLNTNFEWWEGTGGCTGQVFGLQGVQTHEYGHAVGVGHVSEADHGNLTMSTNINGTCSNFEASLGQGDVLALRDLY